MEKSLSCYLLFSHISNSVCASDKFSLAVVKIKASQKRPLLFQMVVESTNMKALSSLCYFLIIKHLIVFFTSKQVKNVLSVAEL